MAKSSGHRYYEKVFVGGCWRKPANSFRLDVISPHSEERIGHCRAAGLEDVAAAVTAARRAFDHGPWPRLAPAERMAAIDALAAIYSGHLDEMADLITEKMGSPRSFSRLGQAAGAAAMMHRALRVVGAIVPWNVPRFLIMPKLIPALIAGCAVVVKPAPETPLDALWMAEMIERIGLPDGVVSILPGGPDAGRRWYATAVWTRSRSPAPARPGAGSRPGVASNSSG